MGAPPHTDDEAGCGLTYQHTARPHTVKRWARRARWSATTVDSSGRACYEDCTFVSRGARDGGSTGDRNRVARPGDRRGRGLQVAAGRRCPGSGRGPSGGGQTRGGGASGQTPAGLRPFRRVGFQRVGDRDIARDRRRRGAHRRDRTSPKLPATGVVVWEICGDRQQSTPGRAWGRTVRAGRVLRRALVFLGQGGWGPPTPQAPQR